MTTYRIVWRIDLEADTAREAAEQALAMQRDPESIATVFDVSTGTGPNWKGVTIDLSETEETQETNS